MKVKFKKVHPDAVTPTRGTENSAGLDITAIDVEVTEDYIEYKTGLALEIPAGYVGLIYPRSSVSKKDLIMANSVGVIDSDFRLPFTFRFKKTEIIDAKIYKVGEKIGQLVIMPYPIIELEEATELQDPGTRTGGYGSTTKG